MKTEKELKLMLFNTIAVMGTDFMEQPSRDFFDFGPGKDIETQEEWDRMEEIRRRTIVRVDSDTYTIKVEFGPHDADTEALLDQAEAIDAEIIRRLKENYERNHSPMPEAG
jgi:hypothetical protein